MSTSTTRDSMGKWTEVVLLITLTFLRKLGGRTASLSATTSRLPGLDIATGSRSLSDLSRIGAFRAANANQKREGAMERNLVGSCGLIVAIGLACQSAYAGDRKSPGRTHDEAKEMFAAREAHAVSLRYDTPRATIIRPFEARYLTSDHGSRRDNRGGNSAAPTSEHRRLTLFHINSKFGDIAVQPVMGQVNGAQLSLGF